MSFCQVNKGCETPATAGNVEIWYPLGWLLIVFAMCLVIGSWVCNVLQCSLRPAPLVVGLVSCAILTVGAGMRMRWPRLTTWRAVAAGCVVLAVCALLASLFYDLSYDGQTYQQEAVLQFARGWNPILGSLDAGVPYDVFLEHYPKAPWRLAAIAYNLTGHIESGKVFNGVFLIASWCLVYTALEKWMGASRLWRWIWALALAANPVVLAQMWSFQVDGQLGSLLLVYIFSLLMVIETRRMDAVILLLATVTLLVNVKFTAVIYAIIIGVLVLAVAGLQRGLRHVLPVSAALVLALSFGCLAIGCDTYVKNWSHHGSPFYPMTGKGGGLIQKMVEANTPSNMRGRNRADALFRGVFGRPQGAVAPMALRMPTPWWSHADLDAYHTADTRIAGWGPLFGFTGLWTLGAVVLGLMTQRRTDMAQTSVIGGIVLLSVLVNPACWWARYAPQVAFLPPILTAGLVRRTSIGMRALAISVVALVLANAAAVACSNWGYNARMSLSIRHSLKHWAEQKTVLRCDLKEFHALRSRLSEAGIRFEREKETKNETMGVWQPMWPAASVQVFVPTRTERQF